MANFSLNAFDSEDVALNFGGPNDLHESVTLLSFRNDELDPNAKITSLVDRNTLYLAIDLNLWIIPDVTAGTPDFTQTFSNCIEAFKLIGDLLLIGLSNGEVHLINTTLKETIGTCSVLENIWFGSKFFIGIYEEMTDGEAFLVLTKKGQFYRVTFMNEEQVLKSELLVDLSHNITAASYSNGQLVAAGNHLFVYDMFLNIVESIDLKDSNIEFKNLWPCNESTYMGLKSNGMLCWICPQVLLIQDMQTTEEMDECLFYNHSKASYLFYVTLNSKLIKMVDFTEDRKEVFNLELDSFEQLVFNTDENENQMYLTRGESSIRVHVIRETKPEDRLQRLIRKMLYEEAEAFAKQYNLSRLDIDKAMVSNYVEKVSCCDADIDKLLELLSNITDVHFNVKSCQEAIAICESIKSVEKIIAFATKLNYKEINDRSFELLLNGTVTSYTTYKLLSLSDGVEMSRSNWQYFFRCDPFEYLISMLRKGKLESAIIIFPRLNEQDFTPGNIVTVLGYLDSYPLHEYTSFMYTMVPTTLRILPEAMIIFGEAFINKVLILERKQREIEFPEKSIEFVDRMLTIINGDAALGVKMPSKEDDMRAMALITNLINISKCLNTILELKNNYDVFLSLQDCLAGPGAMLHALLGLNIKCIEKFLKHFLIKFMVCNGFDADEILGKEIAELMKCHSDYWACHVPQVWRCISSTGKKLELLLSILKAAPKPWCGDLRQMLTQALEYNHPLVADLQCEAKDEPKHIVMYRSEYALRHETFVSLEKDMFVIQRIIYCNLPTLVDDVYTLCTSTECKREANLLLLLHFIELGDLQQVFALINSHTREEAQEYLMQLCRHYRVNFIMKDATLRRTLIQTLDYIVEKVSSVLSEFSCHEKMIQIFKIIDVLPAELLGMGMLDKLHAQNGSKEVLKLIVDDMALLAEDFDAVLQSSKKYAAVFCMPNEQLLFQVSQVVKDLGFLYKTASEVYVNSEDVDTLSLMTVLIMRSVGMEKEDMYGTFFNETIQNDDAGKPVDEKLLQECLSLGMRIISKAYLLSNGNRKVCNVFKWILNSNYLNGELYHEPVENRNPAYFSLCGTKSSMCTLSTAHNVFNMYCDYLQSSVKDLSAEYLTYQFPDMENATMDDPNVAMSKQSFCKMLLERLRSAVPSISRENHHWTLQHILVTIQEELMLFNEPELNKMVLASIGKFKATFLTRVFGAEKIDDNLAFLLLLSYERKKAMKIVNDAINTYKLNFPKFESIVRLGKRLTTYYSSTDRYHIPMLGIKWRNSLTACKLSLREFFILLTKNDLLNPLIVSNEITLEQVTSFCADFKLDTETYYLNYLNHLISTWKPTFDVAIDSLGNRNLVVLSKEEDLTAKCLSVVSLIKNRDAILKCVDTLWNNMNFYNYEVYRTILSIASSLGDARHMQYHCVLRFLKDYRRTHPPCHYEKEEWYARFLSYQSLDSISEFRFPFSPVLFTTDLWKVLRYEVALCNYEKWFALVGQLKQLNKNEICSYVIKNVSFLDEESNAAGDACYNLQPKFRDVLAEVDKCLEHITDPLLAASMAFHLMHKPPMGADRVLTSKLAYKYANICKKTGTDTGNYHQIEKLYFSHASAHILHLHSLATENYLALQDSPDELINALYRDDRILKRSNSCLWQCPNINKAADELSALFGIDMRAKRKALLDTWLNDPNTLMGDADQSIHLSPDVNDAEKNSHNSEYVLRAAYLCTNDEIEYWRDYLHDIFSTNGQYLVQGRVLKTMCMITSPEELNERYDCPYSDMLQTIDNFFVVHDIRSLGIPIDLDQFSSIDKNRLLYKVGKNISDPLNVRVMIAVCETYGISSLDVWEKIIRGMIHLNMISELKKCILMFMRRNIMLCSVVYFEAWQFVVDSSFATLERSWKDSDVALIDLLHFVQSSPVLIHLDLTKALKVCMKLKRYQYAMLLLQYVPDAVCQEYLSELLRRRDRESLLSSMDKLREMGFTGLKYVSGIIQRRV